MLHHGRRATGGLSVGLTSRYIANSGTVAFADDTSYAFGLKNIGTEDATRLVVVAVAAYAASPVTVSSASIAGSAATRICNTSRSLHASMFYRAVPTGSTGIIAVNFSGTVEWCAIAVYALYNLSSNTPANTYEQVVSGGYNELSITGTPTNDFVIGAGIADGDSSPDLSSTLTSNIISPVDIESRERFFGSHSASNGGLTEANLYVSGSTISSTWCVAEWT